MAQKTAWVRVENVDGSNVYSVNVDQPDANEYIMAGGIQSGGAATTVEGGTVNKTAWVRLENVNGSNVYSISLTQPSGSYDYSMSGGLQSGGAATTTSGSPYQVTIGTPNANPAIRLVSTPVDLESGDIVRWFNVVGGTQADVTVNDDGTFTAADGVTSFDWQVDDGEGWGDTATQYITDASVNAAEHAMSGGIQSGGASTAALVSVNANVYSITGGIQSGGTATTSTGSASSPNQSEHLMSGGIQGAGAATTSTGAAVIMFPIRRTVTWDSSQTPELVVGDTFQHLITLKSSASVFDVSGATSIKACIISKDHSTKYTADVEMSSAASGADWSTGDVIIYMTGTQTAAIADYVTAEGLAKIEIQVEIGADKFSWFGAVRLVPGFIS